MRKIYEEELEKFKKVITAIQKRIDILDKINNKSKVEELKKEKEELEKNISNYEENVKKIENIDFTSLNEENLSIKSKIRKNEKKMETLSDKDSKEYKELEEKNKELKKSRKEILIQISDKRKEINNLEKNNDEIKEKVEKLRSKLEPKKVKVQHQNENNDNKNSTEKKEEKQKINLNKDKKEKSNNEEKEDLKRLKEELETLRSKRDNKIKEGVVLSQKEREEISNKIREINKKIKEIEGEKEEPSKTKKTSETKSEEKEYTKSTSSEEDIEKYNKLISEGYEPDSKEVLAVLEKIQNKKAKEMGNKDRKEVEYPIEVKEKNEIIMPEKFEENTSNKNKKEKFVKNEIVPVDKLKIRYSGKNNKYYIENDNTEIEAIKFKNKKAVIEFIRKEFSDADIHEIFRNQKTMEKLARKFDPQLVKILADKNIKFAKEYIKKLQEKGVDNKENLPYEMIYNLKDMRKNRCKTKMSLIERIKRNRLSKKNKNVAEYIPDDKNRTWLVVPIIGAIALGAAALHKDKEKENPQPQQNPYSDKEIPGEDTVKTPNSIPVPDKEDENTIIIEEEENKNQGFTLGSTVKLKDGVRYTQDSLMGGDEGKTGMNSWTKSESYTVDRVALYHEGVLVGRADDAGIKVDEVINETAQKLNVSPEELKSVYHICIGEGHGAPLGWVDNNSISSEDILKAVDKTYEELQTKKEAQNKQVENTQVPEQENEQNR